MEARQALEMEHASERVSAGRLRLHRLGTITANLAERERERLALLWQPHGADVHPSPPTSEV